MFLQKNRAWSSCCHSRCCCLTIYLCKYSSLLFMRSIYISSQPHFVLDKSCFSRFQKKPQRWSHCIHTSKTVTANAAWTDCVFVRRCSGVDRTFQPSQTETKAKREGGEQSTSHIRQMWETLRTSQSWPKSNLKTLNKKKDQKFTNHFSAIVTMVLFTCQWPRVSGSADDIDEWGETGRK